MGALCGGGVDERRIIRCPNCQRRRRMVVLTAVWYDPIFTCLGCGDSWSPEGRMRRPLERGWRRREIERARKRWAEGASRAQVREWLAAELSEMKQVSHAH